MKLLYGLFVLTLLVESGFAQRYRLKEVNPATPDGALLQEITQEQDNAKRVSLLEKFLGQYEKHPAAPWAIYQLVPAYTKAGEFDKAMATGDKLTALDPGDPESAHNALKAAEGKKDADAIRKWAGITSKAACKAAAEPKPAAREELEGWKNRVDYALQVDIYTEYSLFAAAIAIPDPKKKIELAEALEAQNPDSQYLAQTTAAYVLALQQTGQPDKAAAVAEKSLAKDSSNEDMLLVVANYYMNRKDSGPKVVQYGGKLVELMQSKPKPQNVSEADWEKKKSQSIGAGNWMLGVTYSGQDKFVEADKSLRIALPFVKDTPDLLAPTLFYLGLANFKLGEGPKPDKARIQDAFRFSQQCAAMKSPYQAQAQTNVNAISKKYALK